jgi:hypothetical protein
MARKAPTTGSALEEAHQDGASDTVSRRLAPLTSQTTVVTGPSPGLAEDTFVYKSLAMEQPRVRLITVWRGALDQCLPI